MTAQLFHLLSEDDFSKAVSIVGGWDRLAHPDVVIAPDGEPYIYRWHVIPRNAAGANVYFHIQVASDPERPLHDHPWDNVSHILAGGYDEVYQGEPPWSHARTIERRVGDVILRKAEVAHRLILPEDVPYTMTLFTTGPVRRAWGFWINNHRGIPTWVEHEKCIVLQPDGRSIFVQPEV